MDYYIKKIDVKHLKKIKLLDIREVHRNNFELSSLSKDYIIVGTNTTEGIKQVTPSYCMMKHIKSNSVFKDRIIKLKSELESQFIHNIKFRKIAKKLNPEFLTMGESKDKKFASSQSRKPSICSIYMNQQITIDYRKSHRQIGTKLGDNLENSKDKKSYASNSMISKQACDTNFENLAYGSNCLKISQSKRTSIFLRSVRSKNKLSNK